MGADTTIEIGVDPALKARYSELRESTLRLNKSIMQLRPIMEAAEKKKAAGLPILPEQKKYISNVKMQLKEQEEMLSQQVQEMTDLEDVMEGDSSAHVIVMGEVYMGTRITISGASMVVKDTLKYCRFVKDAGEVRITSI